MEINCMDVETRIRTCQLIEKMKKQEAYYQKLGLLDNSKFRGVFISNGRKSGMKPTCESQCNSQCK